MGAIKFLSLLPVALGAVLPREQGAVNYDGYKVYRVAANGNGTSLLNSLSGLTYEQWSYRANDHLDIQMSPAEAAKFEQLGLEYTIMHSDLGADIAAESEGSSVQYTKRQNGALPSDTWFNGYQSYANHVNFWRDLQAAFPANSQSFVAGKSFQNRDIFGLKLFGNNTGTAKPAVIWHSTVHAREWITTMVVEYIAYEMIKGYKARDTTMVNILNKYDLYIIPVANPDGFVFSQTNDRLWRKTRQPSSVSGNTVRCYGTDPNRNWPYQWTGDPNGASTDPCAQTYKGTAAGSTPEIKALVNHMTSVTDRQRLAMYVDWHSYSQLLLSPYGYTSRVPANSNQQVALARQAADAIRAVNGRTFDVGPSGATLYVTTGSSADYATDVAGAQYAYVPELRDTGRNGFVLPASEIRPSGAEMLAAAKVLFLNM